MRRFIKDNRGMTLIELIIAITILGLVATPLLHGFLTSAQTEVKARKMGEVTSVAQNVMEVVEGAGYAEAVKLETYPGDSAYYNFSDMDGNVTYSFLENGHPGTVDYHIGVEDVLAVNGKTYDVMVDIDPTNYNQSINSDAISVYSKMDKTVEIPETPSADYTRDADGKAVLPAKNITMTITRAIKDGKDIISMVVEVQLSSSSTITKYETTYEVHDNEMPAVYMFYHPSYTKYEGRYLQAKDIIKIVNTQDVPIDLYIMKQRNRSNEVSLEDLKVLDDNYECYIEQSLTEYDWNDKKIGAKIYTNVEDNLGKADARPSEVSYKVKYVENNENKETTGTLLSFKTKESKPKRMYQVNVKVYENESGFKGEPLVTLSGSLLK